MDTLDLHISHLQGFMQNNKTAAVYESWWDDTTVNHWRHTRLMSPVLEVLADLKDFRWLTIGDGAGMDAWRLIQAGFYNTVASDLSNAVLEETYKRGHIKEFCAINAEQINLPDESFDFVLCKETLHHMSSPYRAIQECLRIAKFAVVLIEPQDPMIDNPIDPNNDIPGYEEVGNYVYTFSMREIQKIAYGLNLLGVATKGQTDAYIPGCEFAHCVPEDEIWNQTQQIIHTHENYIAQGLSKASYVQAIIFKQAIGEEIFNTLNRAFPRWKFLKTNTNPYLPADRSAAK
jgi:ubiquinone/menaquinone biosynthesis C-methylase UbiE